MINIFPSDGVEDVPHALVEMNRHGHKRNLGYVLPSPPGTRGHVAGDGWREDVPRPNTRGIAIPGF